MGSVLNLFAVQMGFIFAGLLTFFSAFLRIFVFVCLLFTMSKPLHFLGWTPKMAFNWMPTAVSWGVCAGALALFAFQPRQIYSKLPVFGKRHLPPSE